MDDAYDASLMVQIIREHCPDIIIDSINTATAISYQDIDTASKIAKRDFDALTTALRDRDFDTARTGWKEKELAFELLLLSQSLPQLVRHVQMLHRAMVEVSTRLYLKIGTTGTGGMGLNIPYTHSEDKPSAKLMTKTAVAFAHTGLMFLMARTPNGPVVKEIKPGAMIGYADVTCRTIKEKGATTYLYSNRVQPLNGRLVLREETDQYQQLQELDLPVVDTGEMVCLRAVSLRQLLPSSDGVCDPGKSRARLSWRLKQQHWARCNCGYRWRSDESKLPGWLFASKSLTR
jgi:hypothetical protein